MTLRRQLFLIGLILAVLPLGAWQFAREVEQTLRAGHAEGLIEPARLAASLLAEHPDLDWPLVPGDVLFVHRGDQPLLIDGYADDWLPWQEQAQVQFSDDQLLRVELLALNNRDGLHLLISTRNPHQVYGDPAQGAGDHVLLEAVRADGLRARLRLAPLAPGWIETRGDNPEGWPRVQGYWQSRGDGWTLELHWPDRLPPSELRLRVRDTDPGRIGQFVRQIALDATLVQRQNRLDQALAAVTPPGSRAWVVLPSGWVLGHADRRGQPLPSQQRARASWLDTLLFEGLLSGRLAVGQQRSERTARLVGDDIETATEAATWSSRQQDPGIDLSVAVPLLSDSGLQARLVISRDADALLLASNRAALRLLGIGLVGLLLTAALLLGFATLLSERIRRLRDAAERAVDAGGQVRAALPAPRARDEIGDLGRSISQLLTRLKAHQDYLRTLADKLAHELRTPLAMIRSSLDNLAEASDPADIARYRERADAGCDRLNRIFQAMSQAARIEESIRAEAAEVFDLGRLLDDYFSACQATYPERRFTLSSSARPPALLLGSPELFAQLLDKLVDNAVSFSPAGGLIACSLKDRGDQLLLALDNEGSALPAAAERLFESMVSDRPRQSGRVHLGLGLYIARLISDYHGARIRARDGKLGFCVEIELPRASAAGVGR